MIRAHLLCRCLVEETRDLSVASPKGTNPIHEDSTFITYLLPKGPTSKHHHIRNEVLTYEFGGGHKHSTYRNSQIENGQKNKI